MPFKYLGIPMTHRRLRNSDWQGVIDRFEKGLVHGWLNFYLQVDGWSYLIQS
jgi:hypothetical protein